MTEAQVFPTEPPLTPQSGAPDSGTTSGQESKSTLLPSAPGSLLRFVPAVPFTVIP